jgi:hypothetical protein
VGLEQGMLIGFELALIAIASMMVWSQIRVSQWHCVGIGDTIILLKCWGYPGSFFDELDVMEVPIC